MLDTKPKIILNEDYVNDFFFKYLSVVTKPTSKFHGLVLGNSNCNKLVAVKQYLEQNNKLFAEISVNDVISVKIPDVNVIIISTEIKFLERNYDISTAIKSLMESQLDFSKASDEMIKFNKSFADILAQVNKNKKILLVCDISEEEKTNSYNFKSVESRCLTFNYPNY